MKKLRHSGLRDALFVFAPAGPVRSQCWRYSPPDSILFEPMTLEKKQSQMNCSFGLHSPAAPRLTQGKTLLLGRPRRSRTLESNHRSALEFEWPEGE